MGEGLLLKFGSVMRTHRKKVSLAKRIFNVALAILLVAWGAFGIVKDDLLYLGDIGQLHLKGVAAWLMYTSMICVAAILISTVVAHYDQRDNSQSYATFSRKLESIAWMLFAAALIAHVGMAIYSAFFQ